MTDNSEWWAIRADRLIDLLRRAHSGEEPDLLYAEAYANAAHEAVEDDDWPAPA